VLPQLGVVLRHVLLNNGYGRIVQVFEVREHHNHKIKCSNKLYLKSPDKARINPGALGSLLI
jgi:hypothetical protein